MNPAEKFFMKVIENEEEPNLKRWLKIFPVRNEEMTQRGSLCFNISFLPMKPIKTFVKVKVTKKSGGIWIFKLKCVA